MACPRCPLERIVRELRRLFLADIPAAALTLSELLAILTSGACLEKIARIEPMNRSRYRSDRRRWTCELRIVRAAVVT